MASDVFMVKVGNGDPDKVVERKLNALVDASGVLGFLKKDDYTGIKIHFGEEGNTGHIKAEWLDGLIERLRSVTNNIFFTDTNVLYKQSKRTNAVDHLKLAYSHGFGLQKIHRSRLSCVCSQHKVDSGRVSFSRFGGRRSSGSGASGFDGA